MTPVEMTSKQLYARLLRYVVPYWRVFALAIFAMVVLAALEPAFPALIKFMLDKSFVAKDSTVTILVPLGIIFLFLGRGIFSFINSYCMQWVSNKVVLDVRSQMFNKLIYLPTQYYDNHASGMLISKLVNDSGQVTTAATNVIVVLVRDSLTVLFLLGYLLYLNWKLTLITFATVPFIVLTTRIISRRMRKLSRESQKALGQVTHVLGESIESHKIIKIFGSHKSEFAKFFNAINSVRVFNMKFTIAASTNGPVVQLLAAIAIAVIIYIATLQTTTNQISVGDFGSFIIAIILLLNPVRQLTGINEPLQRGLAAAESVFAMMDEPSEPDTGTQEIKRASGAIELKNVSLRYPQSNRDALHNINLNVRPGETIALVGQSGSGKTSLVNLIPRFYHPTSGQILIDGHNIEDLKLASLRENLAMVSQDVVLFNDTVRANIAYGKQTGASEKEIIAAAESAHAMEFIREMSNGLDTFIGENGVRLSGGQRQRLSIARALLKNTPILIMDEATSALDTHSERHVQAALETLMKGRTTIVIAHRLSTIENADRIIVLQKGEIAEIGTHAELMKLNEIYANLYKIQFSLDK